VFVDFEGIDGSGKTTLSNRTARRLRQLGHAVLHARENGELATEIARRVRALTRDAALLEMCPQAEVLLNLARDAQQLEEVVKPALARGEVVITDRYVYSQLALGAGGRGLEEAPLAAAAALAAQGVWPDLVVLVDVEPELARLRKRVAKILDGRDGEEGSRKGLAGAGLQVRVRKHLLAQARRDPARWLVLENEGSSLDELVERIVRTVLARKAARAVGVARARPLAGLARRAAPRGAPALRARLDALEGAFLAALGGLAAREPALAAFLLGGIPGPAAHRRRLLHAEAQPALVARGLRGLGDPDSIALRLALRDRVPADVALGLDDDPAPWAMALRAELYERAPAAVLRGLGHNGSTAAWSLREQGLADGHVAEVVAGLAGIDDDAAWDLRDIAQRRGLWGALGRGLRGVAGARADAARERLLVADRLAGLASLAGVDGPVARRAREALLDRAPKKVLRSLAGIDAPYAWELRERAAPFTKEALDSVDGMDAEEAWSLRQRHAELWPATALSSLEHLAATRRGRAFLERVLARCPGRIAVLRNAYAALAKGELLPPARADTAAGAVRAGAAGAARAVP
jgi:dTMP kinase